MSPKLREALSPLEAELIEQIQTNSQAMVVEFQALRGDIRWMFRLALAGNLALLVGLLFLAAVLATGRGIDPRPAAEAVRTLQPALHSPSTGATDAP